MLEAIETSQLIPFDGSFELARAPTAPAEDAPDPATCRKRLKRAVKHLEELQRVLYAADRYAVLLIFQAMDAAGKDSTIRAVMSGLNPAGCQVYSFKQPSVEELEHDFLWRTTVRLPERGRIGVFNRSYYEEVLVVRVHRAFLEAQRLPPGIDHDTLWEQRFDSIRDLERHLARNGTMVLKFWLNVSREKQRKRFLNRIEEADKNWKFSAADVQERAHWNDYMEAYQAALRATSRPWAPWYAIPADHKPYMRMCVAETIVASLETLDLHYPEVDRQARRDLERARASLEQDDD